MTIEDMHTERWDKVALADDLQRQKELGSLSFTQLPEAGLPATDDPAPRLGTNESLPLNGMNMSLAFAGPTG